MERAVRLRVCAVALVALAPLAAAADGHVGAWVTQVQGQRCVLMLNADGTFSIAGNPGTYRVMGNVMESTSAGGTVRYHGGSFPPARRSGVSTAAPSSATRSEAT